MGTRWRGMLAPINTPTGDGRRMAPGAFTNRPLPLPLKWQRTDESGHTTSVVIGSMDSLDIASDAVWGEGELFDDASPTALPRLAEDVAEAKLLLGKKVIGPSVDPGSAHAVTVMKGSNTPLDDAALERYWLAHGTLPETELLFTDYEIAAATLVPVPAFAQCRPFELLDGAAEPMADRSLVAAAPLPALDPALFRDPELSTYTQLTMRDLGNGWIHVFGHVATHDVCHVGGMRGVCTTAPYSDQDYVPFHRYSVTRDGHELPVMAGRLTAGHGKFENLCACHKGNDDHACGNLSFGGAVAHHDQMETLAYVCSGEDEKNNAIWFSGVMEPATTERDRALLRRRKVSGDWRQYGASMELTEVLVLSRREPGFPLPRVSVENGRQLSLTAAGVILPQFATENGSELESTHGSATVVAEFGKIDYDRLGASVARHLMDAADSFAAASVTAAVRSDWDIPLAPDGRQWDKGAAVRRLVEWADGDISGKYARAFLWRDPDADPDLQGSYRLPIADVIDGELRIVPNAVRNASARLEQVDGLDPDDERRIRSVLDKLFDRIHEQTGDMAVTAAVRTTGWDRMPIAPDGREWDDLAAKRRLSEWAGDDISGKYARAFLYRSDGADPDLKTAYGLPIADVIDGELTIVAAAVRNAASRLPQMKGVPQEQRDRLRTVIDRILERTREARGDMAADNGCGDGRHRMPDGSCMDDDSMTAAAKEGGHTGAMVALRMTDADAARLAVDGGLPADEMHMTLAYLGEADAITPEAREKIMRGMTRIAKKVGAPMEADGFSVNAFNPGDANDRPTAIVMGVNGATLGSLQQGVCKTLGNCEGFDMPEQHEPWTAHVTLAYDDDLSRIGRYADRVGPLTFDRMRIAFGGEVTDIPLGEIIKADGVERDERDDAMYARSARANQLSAQLWLAADTARRDRTAELADRINATLALAE